MCTKFDIILAKQLLKMNQKSTSLGRYQLANIKIGFSKRNIGNKINLLFGFQN